MGLRALAESIILQSLKDLEDPDHREESIRFFAGEGFSVSAEMAGLGCIEKKKILALSGLLTVACKGRVPQQIFASGGSH